jgi:phosphatidate cytidylyltransferase
MRNLLVRTISGILLVLIILGSILLSEYSMLTLVLAIYSLGLYEFRTMFPRQNKTIFFLFLIAGMAMLIFAYLFFKGTPEIKFPAFAAAIYVLLITLTYLFVKGFSSRNSGQLLFAFFWLAGSLVFFMALGWTRDQGVYNPIYIIILISLIWIFDIGAFVFGSLLGRTPLAPSISPGKTVEGVIFGMLLNTVAGYVAFRITGDFSIVQWILISFVVSVGGTAGDLLESKIKREAGVKDSGQIIPGHGGILDRFDSLLFSTPLFLITIEILKSI